MLNPIGDGCTGKDGDSIVPTYTRLSPFFHLSPSIRSSSMR